jgi:hypothetical protein
MSDLHKEVSRMGKFESFKLRMALLRVWGLKNLGVFLNLFFVVGIILVFTGQINENTPFLGDIFGSMSIAFREALTQGFSNPDSGDIFVNSITAVLTFLVTIGMLSTNMKRLALADIKSRALKKALVQAGMYFNQDGKLVRRLEEAAKIDLNGDNKIGDTGVHIDDLPKEGLIPGLKRAGEELGTIMTMKIEGEHHADEIKSKANLAETERAIATVRNTAIDEAAGKVSDKAIELLGQKVGSRTSIFKLASDKIKSTVSGLASWVKNLFKKREKTPEQLAALEAKRQAKLAKQQQKAAKKSKVQQVAQPQPAQQELSPRELRNKRYRENILKK